MTEEVNANKAKLGRDAALELARQAHKLVVAKGKKVTTFDLRNDRPGNSELLAAMLGPTGNLRAPTLSAGNTLLVGFNPDVYAEEL